MAMNRQQVAQLLSDLLASPPDHPWIESLSMAGERQNVDIRYGPVDGMTANVSEFRLTTHEGEAFTVLVYGE